MGIKPLCLLPCGLLSAAVLLLIVDEPVRGAAPGAAAPPAAEAQGESPLAVEPSGATLAGGKAKLTMAILRRRGTTYLGTYQIKVVPYFFKNETGKLFITISDAQLQKAKSGSAVEFGGKAVTDGTGKTRPVTVKAAPAANGASGTLTIVIPTDRGDLIFRPGYRFVEE